MDPRFLGRDQTVLPDILEDRAALHPNRVFAVFSDEDQWTYETMAKRTWSLAGALQGLGVAPGDYVLSWLPTGSHALETWFGINAAGGVYTPLNTSYRGKILEHAVNLSGARVMICHEDLINRLNEIETPTLETVIVVGNTRALTDRRFLRWDDLDRTGRQRPTLTSPREPWDDMAVIFTSGTTGSSKGVRCSYLHHRTYGSNLFPQELGADDRYYLCLPMYHAAATNAIYTFLLRSGSLAVTETFVTDRFWDDVRKYRATCSNLATAMATFLYKAPRRSDDADNPLRMAYMGPMPDEVEDFCDRFQMQVFTCYGSTEVPCPIFTGPVSKHTRSVGQLRGAGFEVRIVDEHDGEVGTGKVGELVVRHSTPWVMFSGYLGMKEVTAEVWRNGWFHTGDGMSIDSDGNYFFSDRMGDTIRRRAENISSVEVESEITAHPGILEAAVIAVPSEFQEDEVMAFIVPRPGETIDYEELVGYLVPRLPYFMVPRYFEIVDDLPRTPTFKVRKVDLRNRGISPATWDREAQGIRLKRERFAGARDGAVEFDAAADNLNY